MTHCTISEDSYCTHTNECRCPREIILLGSCVAEATVRFEGTCACEMQFGIAPSLGNLDPNRENTPTWRIATFSKLRQGASCFLCNLIYCRLHGELRAAQDVSNVVHKEHSQDQVGMAM